MQLDIKLICVLIFFLSLSGCFGAGPVYEADLGNSYRITAMDTMSDLRFIKVTHSEGNVYTYDMIVMPTVIAAGWDNKFVIVKQHPSLNAGIVNTKITNYYILRRSDGKRFGPYSKEKYNQQRAKLEVAPTLDFSILNDNF